MGRNNRIWDSVPAEHLVLNRSSFFEQIVRWNEIQNFMLSNFASNVPLEQ